MEPEPSSSDATSAPAALFAWVRDSAPAPGRLGLRGRGGWGLPASAWAVLGWAAEIRARRWLGWRILGRGRKRRGRREGSSRRDRGPAGWWGPGRRGCDSVGRTCLQIWFCLSRERQRGWFRRERITCLGTLWVTWAPHPAIARRMGFSPAPPPPPPGGSLLPSEACGVWRCTKAETLHHCCCSAVAGSRLYCGNGSLRRHWFDWRPERQGHLSMSWLGERRVWQVLDQMHGNRQTSRLSSS